MYCMWEAKISEHYFYPRWPLNIIPEQLQKTGDPFWETIISIDGILILLMVAILASIND